MPQQGSIRRGRGERAGLDRARILDAARRLDPATLTMQNVADELGVDRKALHNYVDGREALLGMLAEEAMLQGMTNVSIEATATWQEACRIFAARMRASLVASGALLDYFKVSSTVTLGATKPAELVLERLLDAGFSEERAGRTLLLLTTISVGFAREEVVHLTTGGHPQVETFRAMLAAHPEADLSVLRRLDGTGFDPYGDAQFEFDVETCLSGLETLLP